MDRLSGEFWKRYALLIVALIERWIHMAVIIAAAATNSRADSYSWEMMWRKLVVLATLNVALDLVSCFTIISKQNMGAVRWGSHWYRAGTVAPEAQPSMIEEFKDGDHA